MRDKIKKINELCRKDGIYKNDKVNQLFHYGVRLNILDRCLAMSLV